MLTSEENNTNSTLDTLVRVDKLELLFQQSFPAIFISIIIAIVLAVILWPVQDHSILLTWFTILVFSALGRYAFFIRYQKVSPQGEDILNWEIPYLATLMLTTLTWGIGSVVIMPIDSPIHQLVVIAFMIGMSGGAISLYSAHRLMTLITVAIMLLPATGWFLFNGTLLSAGMAIGVVIFFLSAIHATKTLSSALHQSFSLTHALSDIEEKYRLAMEATRDGLWDWDVATGDVYYSPGWSRILGEEDIQPDYSTWIDRIHPEDKPHIQKTLHSHLAGETDIWQEEHRLKNADDDWIWVLGRGQVVERNSQNTPLRMVGTMTDINSRKQAENEQEQLQRELRQKQKMEAVGQLTSGIAHDFNNIMGIILGYAELAYARCVHEDQTMTAEYINNIQKAGDSGDTGQGHSPCFSDADLQPKRKR